MRTFVAIQLPVAVQNDIDGTSRRLRDHLRSCNLARSVRWVSAAKLHLTLRFLGETSLSQQRQMADGLSVAVQAHQPFQLCVAELGCFPNLGAPRVVWLGVGGDLSRLKRLQTDVERVAQQAGYESESRPYSPHLTIGRVRQGLPKSEQRKLGDCLAGLLAAGSAPQLEFDVQSCALIRSVLKPEGAQYTVLERFLLG